MEQLENLIQGLVDPDLATRFQVAAVRKNRLILITPAASWATRFRTGRSPRTSASRLPRPPDRPDRVGGTERLPADPGPARW